MLARLDSQASQAVERLLWNVNDVTLCRTAFLKNGCTGPKSFKRMRTIAPVFAGTSATGVGWETALALERNFD